MMLMREMDSCYNPGDINSVQDFLEDIESWMSWQRY